MQTHAINLNSDLLSGFLKKVSAILDQPIDEDKIEQAVVALEHVEQGDEQDLDFELKYQGTTVSMLIKAGVKHFEESLLEISSTSPAFNKTLCELV
ncbi:MAG: hypothetical protein H6999_04365 [Hahellaceae bacterium]|nr:hypothetical protein [Hahellaceae bacterium]MCP5168972.1 hypothetical protein [Hahellaceae bacterium]